MSKNTDRSIDIDATFPMVLGCYDTEDQLPSVALRFFDESGILTSSGWTSLYESVSRLDTVLENADETDVSGAAILAAEAAIEAALAACPEYVVDLHSGEAIDDEDVAAAIARCDWTGLWPIIDGDCCLTGRVVDNSSDGYLSCDWGGMIDADIARSAGWRIDAEEGTAAPSEPVTVEFATADETIGWNAGLREMAPSDHPAQADACAAYRRAAIIAMADDARAGRLRAEAPRDRRTLHSQWCGAHWGYSAGAIGTRGRDLTADERAAIDAANEAGLEAAREVFANRDAASLESWSATHRIQTDAGEVIDVMLDDGVAYSAAEWVATAAADYECDEAGRWLFQGQPFAGSVEPIYKIAFMLGSTGGFEVVETFSASGNNAANAYAEEHYAGRDWYVLDFGGENINA